MGVATASAAAKFTRKTAEKAYTKGYGEAPPERISSPSVPLKQAILWAVLSGVAVGLVRLMVERTAAAAWVRARGELPPALPRKRTKRPKPTTDRWFRRGQRGAPGRAVPAVLAAPTTPGSRRWPTGSETAV